MTTQPTATLPHNTDNITHTYLNTNSDNTTHSNITAHTDHDINLTTQSFDYNITTHDNNTTFTEPNNIPAPKHLPKCNRPFNRLFILLLLPFILLCLINNVAFNVEFRDCKQGFMYHGRNLYITNIFNYTHLKFNIFNNNVNNTNRSLPISGIAYKLDGDFPSKNFTHKIHYKSGPETHTIKLVFFPLIFLFMVTISNWIRKETFSYYTSIKHKYLFLKSRRHSRKHGTLFVFQKVLLFLLVVLTFDAKLPSRTQNDLNTAIVKDNELFTIQYITTADVIRSNHIKNQSSLYALTKLKFLNTIRILSTS